MEWFVRERRDKKSKLCGGGLSEGENEKKVHHHGLTFFGTTNLFPKFSQAAQFHKFTDEQTVFLVYVEDLRTFWSCGTIVHQLDKHYGTLVHHDVAPRPSSSTSIHAPLRSPSPIHHVVSWRGGFHNNSAFPPHSTQHTVLAAPQRGPARLLPYVRLSRHHALHERG